MRNVLATVLLSICMVGVSPAQEIKPSPATNTSAALRDLMAAYPGVKALRESGRVTRLYGAPMSYGVDAVSSSEAFRLSHAEALGVASANLVPEKGQPGSPIGQPLLYDHETGKYRFVLFKYRQEVGGVKVFDSDLRVLVRADGDFPMVLAVSSVRDLDGFTPQTAGQVAFNPATDADTKMDAFSGIERVVWAGTDKLTAQPRDAITFVGEKGQPDAGPYEKWRFVVDAKTGEVLLKENMIQLEDVSGSVSGLVTEGVVAEQCGPEVSTVLPYAYVEIAGGNSANADVNGDFTIPNAGSSSVTVNSYARGTYFQVSNAAGSNVVLSQSVTPPGPVDFLHNSANNDELIRAQINGYANANEVRDFILYHDPASPVISTQTNFTVRVNRTDGFCPGNAWYDGAAINFCQSAIPNYPNTSFAGVSQHEYGHHVVESGGSGQGEYGEGMSDVIASLVADNPALGLGFFYTDCSTPLRNADNNCQYSPSTCSSCGSEIHDCGQLLAGCVWDLRNNLAANYPATYLDIVVPLALSSIQLHGGTSITPAITTDFLTLDDDDADLSNGTPHSVEILAAFDAHSMVPGPPPANDTCGNAEPICTGIPVTGNTVNATNDGAASCGTSDSSPDVWYTYTPQTSGSATFSLCSGTSYDAVLSVHSGCPGSAGNDLGCDDDGCGSTGGPSTVTISVTEDTTYYVRVTGWQGSAGNYTLLITGPDCVPDVLGIEFPDGAPQYVEPNTATTIGVEITDGSESYQPGTGMLHYRFDGGAFLTSSLTPLGGTLFEVVLPAASCTDSPEFYLSAESNLGTAVTHPANAPMTVLSAGVGVVTAVLDDYFQSDQGWVVSGDALDGQWERGVPVNGARGDPPNDADGSGSCYVTDNVAGNSDVDDGTTTLTSPVMDMSSGGVISYAYWLNDIPSGALGSGDTMEVDVATDAAGMNWQNLRSYDTASPVWRTDTILVGTEVAASSTIRIRFSVSDLSPGNVVEGGVDDFHAFQVTCDAVSCSDGVLNQGEDLIDCGGPCPACNCLSSIECEDVSFCNGGETCDAFGECQNGVAPCAGGWCREADDSCHAYGAGDFEPDGDVDLVDYAMLLECFGQPAGTGCEPGNMTGDEVIDLADLEAFISQVSGPNP